MPEVMIRCMLALVTHDAAQLFHLERERELRSCHYGRIFLPLTLLPFRGDPPAPRTICLAADEDITPLPLRITCRRAILSSDVW